jgi:hypothetical protein
LDFDGLSTKLGLLSSPLLQFSPLKRSKEKEGRNPPNFPLPPSSSKNGEGVPQTKKKESEWLVQLDLLLFITLELELRRIQNLSTTQYRVYILVSKKGSKIQKSVGAGASSRPKRSKLVVIHEL